MIKQIHVQNFSDVRRIVDAASGCVDEIGVHDMQGAIADAKSILGLMRLDYTHPVKLVSENERELGEVARALVH